MPLVPISDVSLDCFFKPTLTSSSFSSSPTSSVLLLLLAHLLGDVSYVPLQAYLDLFLLLLLAPSVMSLTSLLKPTLTSSSVSSSSTSSEMSLTSLFKPTLTSSSFFSSVLSLTSLWIVPLSLP